MVKGHRPLANGVRSEYSSAAPPDGELASATDHRSATALRN
jgi:hypothetical protein